MTTAAKGARPVACVVVVSAWQALSLVQLRHGYEDQNSLEIPVRIGFSRFGRLRLSAEPENHFAKKPNKTGGPSDSCAEPEIEIFVIHGGGEEGDCCIVPAIQLAHRRGPESFK